MVESSNGDIHSSNISTQPNFPISISSIDPAANTLPLSSRMYKNVIKFLEIISKQFDNANNFLLVYIGFILEKFAWDWVQYAIHTVFFCSLKMQSKKKNNCFKYEIVKTRKGWKHATLPPIPFFKFVTLSKIFLIYLKCLNSYCHALVDWTNSTRKFWTFIKSNWN